MAMWQKASRFPRRRETIENLQERLRHSSFSHRQRQVIPVRNFNTTFSLVTSEERRDIRIETVDRMPVGLGKSVLLDQRISFLKADKFSRVEFIKL
jgi:hypothetical protein